MRTLTHALALTSALVFGFAAAGCDKKEDKKDEKKADDKKADDKQGGEAEAKAGGDDKKEGEGGW